MKFFKDKTSKDWWGNSKNAQAWIDQNKRKSEAGEIKDNTTLQSTCMVMRELDKRMDDFKTVLEVGSGDGRLIGEMSILFSKIECSATDINKKLIKYIDKKYPAVKTFFSDITDIECNDNSYDLVFTYQVLQHVDPEHIEKAISELVRIAKKEVWMWEGIGKLDYKHGDQTSKAHNGSWVWHIDKMIDCYEVSVPKNENIELSRQRLYKFKKS